MKRKLRMVSLALAVCILLGSGMLPVQAANPGGVQYLNTHVNTGHQRQDILAVAMTQLGYTEKKKNDSKYGDWFGYPGYDWCAMFVSWCARQADVSEDVIKQCSWAHPNTFGIPYQHGSQYTPKPGDLFFSENFAHVGMVLSVEGDCFYSIEGNAKYHDINIPDDPSEESYYVMTNKRKINKYYYGIPAYKGDDLTHDYVRGFEKAHPHKIYYQCRTCGDRYDTGYTQCVSDCGKCLNCSCDPSYAGYYLVSSSGSVKIRKSHSTSAGYLGFATVGEAVYVYGADPKTGLAYVDYDGLRGHVELQYLTKYHDIPAAPQVTSPKTDYILSDRVTLNWNLPKHTEEFRMKIWKDGVLYLEKAMELTRSFELNSLLTGNYEVQVIACNRSGASQAGTLIFTVRDTYTVTYDARSGSGAPKSQTQTNGETLTLSSQIPVREGYTFLGWTDDPKGNFVVYEAGATLRSYEHVTLYAVWKENDAVSQEMKLHQLPERLIFLLREELDTTGLALEMTYSDGSGHLLTEGFETTGFDAETYGTKTVAVRYDGLEVSFDVQVAPYLPGDMDLNKKVNRDDVMGLLWHISFPDRFTIDVPGDFNNDEQVNRDDVMQLLWHVSFPERFPLEIIWPEEEPPEEEPPEEEPPEEEPPEEEPPEEEPPEEEPTETTEPSVPDSGEDGEDPGEDNTGDGENPGEDNPGGDGENPGEGNTGDGENPGEDNTGSDGENPGEDNTGDGGENPGGDNPGSDGENPGEGNTGDGENPGEDNTGDEENPGETDTGNDGEGEEV